MAKKKKQNNPGNKTRLLRGLVAFVLVIGVLGLIGSWYMRSVVVDVANARAITSGSAVYSKAFALNRGTDISAARLFQRLNRIGYRKVKSLPKSPGEYYIERRRIFLYLHESDLPSGETQRAHIVDITVDANSRITDVRDFKFDTEANGVQLEPEVISILGTSSTRASSPRRLEQFPTEVRDAVLAAEDHRFRLHFGVDPLAIIRASYVNMKSGRVVQGGSTLTQQLAKNLFFSAERTLSRKLFEAFAALLIETAFSKDQILELYLNEVYLGQEGRVAIHGFGEAARSFFGKDVADISLSESALLSGIISAPSKYNPRKHPGQSKQAAH